MGYGPVISDTLFALIQVMPLFGNIINRCRVVDNRSEEHKDDIAYVTINRDSLEMNFCGKFQSLIVEHRIGVAIHECYHIVFNHLDSTHRAYDQLTWNYATDCSINQLIDKNLLPKDGVTLEKIEALVGEKLEIKMPAEYYYEKLKPHKDKLPKSGKVTVTLGNEDQNGKKKGSGTTVEMTAPNHENSTKGDLAGTSAGDMITRELINQAVSETLRKHGSGSVPNHIMDAIKEGLKRHEIPWWKVLQQYIGSHLSNNYTESRSRPNRRLQYQTPGRIVSMTPSVLVMEDQSASVSNEQRSILEKELRGITELSMEDIEVGFFDDGVWPETVKIGAENRKALERKVTGGTNFTKVIEFTNKKRCDVIIILTDGEAPAPDIRSNKPIVWVICGGVDNNKLPGKRILLDVNKQSKTNS